MTLLVAVRFRFLALLFSLALSVVGAGPARGDVIAQYALAELSDPAVLNHGRSGTGYEATTVDPNATAIPILISDSIPPSAEEYIELTSPPYSDANGNDLPVLRLEPGNNSNTPAEAITKDKYFQFTVTAADGFVLNLSSLTFDAARGGTGGGPLTRGWVLLSSVDGFTSIIDTQDVPNVRPDLMNFSVNLSGASYQGLTTVTFRVYSYVAGGGRSVEYSNVTLNGKVQ